MVESDRNEHAHFVDRANPEFKSALEGLLGGHGSELAAWAFDGLFLMAVSSTGRGQGPSVES